MELPDPDRVLEVGARRWRAGNAMVFKPSELTPLTAMELAAIYTEAGVPDGVFNVVQGDGRVGDGAGAAPGDREGLAHRLGADRQGGHGRGGRHVEGGHARTRRQVAAVVFEDADLDNAVSAALLANFYTQGEICSNGTRVFVHRESTTRSSTRSARAPRR